MFVISCEFLLLVWLKSVPISSGKIRHDFSECSDSFVFIWKCIYFLEDSRFPVLLDNRTVNHLRILLERYCKVGLGHIRLFYYDCDFAKWIRHLALKFTHWSSICRCVAFALTCSHESLVSKFLDGAIQNTNTVNDKIAVLTGSSGGSREKRCGFYLKPPVCLGVLVV